MSYKIRLAGDWDSTPDCWKVFIENLRGAPIDLHPGWVNTDNNINKALVEYNGYTTPRESYSDPNYLVFETEEDYLIFLLKNSR